MHSHWRYTAGAPSPLEAAGQGEASIDVYSEAMALMDEQFGHDVVMSLATVNGDQANMRTVKARYRDGAFHVTTCGLSSKMKEIAANPSVALCHGLFVAHGTGTDLGNPLGTGQ